MSIFAKRNRYFDLAFSQLRSSLLERDHTAQFAMPSFQHFAAEGLFTAISSKTNETELEVLANYYNIARASLDLPFASSLAAHGYVGSLMLQKFGNADHIARFAEDMATGHSIGAICNSEHGTSTNLKGMQARISVDNIKEPLSFVKPCITNGAIADLLFTSLWNASANGDQLEIFLLTKNEVLQRDVTGDLVGFRTGNSGSVAGAKAQSDILERRLTTDRASTQALRYCFFIERLIVAVMATGLAHGIEDYLLHEAPPKALEGIAPDQKQYLQEKILEIHMTRIQMTSLIESIVHRGPAEFLNNESELAVLKMLISKNLRSAIFSAIEAVGHRSLQKQHLLPKVLRDVEICSFFGGTQELQKMSLYALINPHKKGIKVA